MRMIIPIAAAVLGAAGTAGVVAATSPDTREAALVQRWIADKTPSKPVSCISLRQIRSTKIVNDAIYYRDANRTVYRNDPPGGCRGFGSGTTIIQRTPSTLLCSGEIIQVADLGSRISRGCSLGKFTPYRAG